MSAEHHLDASRVHHDWDAAREPVLEIASGDVVHFDLPITGDGQVDESSTAATVVWDFETIYNLGGPVRVEGARPGSTLEVEVLALTPGPWGWTAFIPGTGLLPDDFPDPYIRVFDLTNGELAYLRDDIAIPIEPFFGTMGVCPAGAKEQAVMPPGRFGGNMDTRQLVRGTTLYLPVEVEGALFSCGDAHAAQGDGEVCVTGIEAPMRGELRFTLEKGRQLPAQQLVENRAKGRVDLPGAVAKARVVVGREALRIRRRRGREGGLGGQPAADLLLDGGHAGGILEHQELELHHAARLLLPEGFQLGHRLRQLGPRGIQGLVQALDLGLHLVRGDAPRGVRLGIRQHEGLRHRETR